MDESHQIYERISRIETVQERSDIHIQELTKTMRELAAVTVEQANQKESIKRIADRQDIMLENLTKLTTEFHSRYDGLTESISEIKTNLGGYGDLEKEVAHNSFITKLITAVSGAVMVATLSILVTLFTNTFGE